MHDYIYFITYYIYFMTRFRVFEIENVQKNIIANDRVYALITV